MKIIKKKYVYKVIITLSIISVALYLLELFGINTDLLYYLHKNQLIKAFSILPKNLFLFGFINTLLNTFGIYSYEKLMFFSSLGGVKLINGGLVCGIVNLAKCGSEKAALFLTAKALFSFALIGALIALAVENKEHCRVYLFIALCLLLTGNVTPALLLLLLTRRQLYYLSLLFSFLSCIIAYLADRAFVFYVSPSVFELFLHSTARVYLFAVMLFIISASYLITRLVNNKLK